MKDAPTRHLWQRAAALAARMHHGQFRKDGRTPYFAHPVRVALTIRTVFDVDDEVVLAAALLHDVIEDTPADYDDIEDACGSEVADLVAAMSKDMRVREDRREDAYFRQLAEASWKARLIKLADVYDNLIDSHDERRRRRALERAGQALQLAGDDPRLATARRIVENLVADLSE